MKKVIAILLLLAVIMAFVTACSGKDAEYTGEVIFSKDRVVSLSFDGLGVEWGTYEDTNKTVKGSWDRVLTAVDRLNPALVRCMTNLDWFVVDFDKHGTDDAEDDTWGYNFNNKQMVNACDVLDYCQENGVKVAFGVWNVIGNADQKKDIYGMIPNASADPRWAKMCADLMEYLIKVKGYTCISWFVNTNEPNITGNEGSSKNYYNTYEKWEQGVKNIRKAFDAIDLKYLDIIGGDTTGITGCEVYLPKIASKLSNVVNNYGIHMYVTQMAIEKGTFKDTIRSLYNITKKKDSDLGKTKQMYIWESGLLTGKNDTTDCQALIRNYEYGYLMADYTIQSILGGVNGVVYWDLDDAMHFMYGATGATAKEWGMFSTLASASPAMQEYRPWYHSSVLLTNLFRPGNVLYDAGGLSQGMRVLATVSEDRTKGGYCVVNSTTRPVTGEFVLEESVKDSGKLYIYVYNEQNLKLGEDGFVVPNYVVDGNLNKKTSITVPAKGFVVVSSERL